MGLLDQLFYGGMQEQQGDPQGALLSELLKLKQPQQAPAQPPLPTGHVMPQAQAQAPPEPNFLDRMTAMARGYGEGGLIGGISDAINLGDSRGERAQAQQRNQAVDYLIANGIDPQTAQMAPSNPELMKSLFGSVVSKRYGDKGEEFKEVDGVGYGIRRGPDGNLMQRRLDGGEAGAPASLIPGTIEGTPRSTYKDANQVAGVASKLRGDFEGAPVYKNHAATSEAFRKLERAFSEASPAGDIAATYSFMKMMDPNSVVRESEFMMLGKTGSLPEQIQQLFNRAASGEGLTPAMRADIQKKAREVYANSQTFFKKHKGNYTEMAQRFRIDPRNVVYDFEDAEPAAPAAPPAPQQGQRLDMGAVQGRSGPLVAPPVRISSDTEFDKLPPGTPFMGPDGVARRKP
jgi:hypothetical protein